MIKKVLIFGNLHRTDMKKEMSMLIDFLNTQGITISMDEYLHSFIKSEYGVEPKSAEIVEDNDFQADVALSFGGDGTFLNTAARIGNKEIPILGINTGRLGFLADVPREKIIEAMKSILHTQYSIEERSLIKVETQDGTILDNPFALNDVAISKQDSSSMIIVNALHKHELINSYQADGLIISTPTGSTAYSMSTGGPIMYPMVNSWVISPVASHSLTVRPLVVPDDWTIDLNVESRSNSYLISIDGRSKILHQTTKIRLRKANHKTKIIKPNDNTFFNTLRNKLLWGADVRN